MTTDNACTEVARILTQLFDSQTFHPRSILANVLSEGDSDDAGSIRWCALSESGTLVNSIDMTLSEFIQYYRDGHRITLTYHKPHGWQLYRSASDSAAMG